MLSLAMWRTRLGKESALRGGTLAVAHAPLASPRRWDGARRSRCLATPTRDAAEAVGDTSGGPERLTFTAPDDWHLHLRDGDVLADVVPHSASQFSRAIVMPNLTPPVTTAKLACEYRARIMAHVPEGSSFEPLMTLYLTDNTPAEEVHRAKEAGVRAFKLYPAGATTNSDSGVTDVRKCFGALKAMEETGTLLLVHGEVVDPKIDIFDRERVFIETVLPTILDNFPNLKVVLEHITTKHAARFVLDGPKNVAASVTPQHMLLNRNALLVGGIKPHFYCLPILKREEHRLAIVEAATSGHPRFFLGTDSAPHADQNKLSACGCAGIYSAPLALQIYAQVFEENGALDRFEGFASVNGAAFYGMPRNERVVELVREDWRVPANYKFGDDVVVPLGAGLKLRWRLRT